LDIHKIELSSHQTTHLLAVPHDDAIIQLQHQIARNITLTESAVVVFLLPENEYRIDVTVNRNGMLHSYASTPSLRIYKGGNVIVEAFHKNGKSHKITGPAYISPHNSYWAINGCVINSKDEYLKNVSEQDKDTALMTILKYGDNIFESISFDNHANTSV